MIIFFFFFDENPWAEIIKRERKNNGLTQTELGQKIGKSMRAVQTYENGSVTPPDKVLEQIASVFGYSIPGLLDKYGQYDEPIPSHFDGDVDKWEAFKKARDQDVEEEYAEEALLAKYRSLNLVGKEEAYKRISELAELPKYITKKS